MRRSRLFALIVTVALGTSACVTTLGYVPEYAKPGTNGKQLPSYAEVKKWAYDVMDGYDTRATTNRQAIYGGALLAAAAAGAVTGLAAFSAGSAAIIGIPIGTAFLASVMAIYSSEPKARIYGLASRNVKDLLTMSDVRLAQRGMALRRPAEALADTRASEGQAQARLQAAQISARASRDVAAKAKAAADAAPESTDEEKAARKALVAAAEDAEKRAKQTAAAERDAEAAVAVAQRRVAAAILRLEAWNALLAAKAKLATEEVTPGPDRGSRVAIAKVELAARDAAWAELRDVESAEAICIRYDVADVMRRVGEHIDLLDPQNVAARLRDIKAPAEGSSGTDKAGEAAAKLPPSDYSDLVKVSSRCEGET